MPGLRHTKICILSLSLLLSGSCQSSRVHRDLDPLPSSSQTVKRGGVPHWFGMPKDWSRLDEIETWLVSSESHDPKWRNYGRIELAKGWLEMSPSSAKTAAYRHTRARKLLDLVRSDPQATAAHKQRASRLLDGANSPTQAGALAGVQHRSSWGALPANRSRLSPVGGTWEKITVHHSDLIGSFVFDGSAQESRAVVKSIQRHHLTENGWGDIGYHFLIDARGRVFEGRSIKWQGAHAGDSKKNRRNLGICLLGNFDKSHPTQAARDSLSDLLDDLRRTHKISRKKVYLHSEMTSTDCPGRHLSDWINYYRTSP